MQVAPVSRNFDLGFQSDAPRDQLGRGAAWRMKGYIPRQDAPLRKMGGWTYGSKDLNAVSAISRVEALGYFPTFSGAPLVIQADNGKVFTSIDPGSLTNAIEATYSGSPTLIQQPSQNPVYAKSNLMVFPASLRTGTDLSPLKLSYAGTFNLATLGGTPPHGRIAAQWGDYTILANAIIGGVEFINRAWFSGAGNPESWNTTSGYWDFPSGVYGITPLKTSLLFFGQSQVWSLVGTTPPPGGDLTRRTLFDVGISDGRSLARYRDYAIWANSQGVYRTDGQTLTDLTELAGISIYYRSLLANNDVVGLVGGVYRGHYFLTLTKSDYSEVATLVYDIDRQVWYELPGIGALCYAEANILTAGAYSALGVQDIFFGYNGVRVGKVSSIFDPQTSNKANANGTAILPVLETPFYKMGGASLKRVRRVYVTYELSEGTLAVDSCTSPETGAPYTSKGTLPASSVITRQPVEIRERAYGVGLRLTASASAATLRVHEIELEGHGLGSTK